MMIEPPEEPHAPQIKRDSKTDPDLGGAFAGALLMITTC